ncbi:hypothetical protein DFJ74DRAFT_641289 [Hyaloraphidium curvatum]|nr:hypothetical protein DFJ74DRAFT_641289 [Hyaloraphidium curvatum]
MKRKRDTPEDPMSAAPKSGAKKRGMTDLRVKELNPDTDGTNTFKFVSFKDRLKKVRVGTTRLSLAGGLRAQLRDEADEHDATFSFFNESVQKWKELNCTTDYTRFAREVGTLSHSLPMVLFNKEALVEALLKHLAVPDTTAADGLMDAVVGLAKDLEEELYPWFPRVLEAMVPFLDSDDAKAVEVGTPRVGSRTMLY